jgi:hypothetical protein
MEPKLTCNMDTCNRVMGVFETHYEEVPDDALKLEIMKRKFTAFKETLGSRGFQCEDYICFPLLQLASKIEISKT